MMHIEHPYYVFGALAVPVVTWLYIRSRLWRKKVLQQFGEWRLVEQLISGRSKARPLIKFAALLLSLLLIIFGLVNVQSGSSKRTIQHAGIDIAVVLDVSTSMLAEDVKPSRLELAKHFANQLIYQMPDQRIALITFAATPILQTPLTIDHSAAELLLGGITAEDAPSQGTNLEAALNEALKALPENQQHYRAIVLISDGEEKEGRVEDAMNEFSQEHIVICTVGIGTEKGAAIPMVVNGQQTTKRDRSGNIVITKFNEEVLKDIAQKNNGVFVNINASSANAVSEIAARLDAVNKNLFDEQLLVQYESRFQWFLFPALLLLILELFFSSKKSRWLKNQRGKNEK